MARHLLATSLLLFAACFEEVDTDDSRPSGTTGGTNSDPTMTSAETSADPGTSSTEPSASTSTGESMDTGTTSGPADSSSGSESTDSSSSSTSDGGFSVCPMLIDRFEDGVEEPYWIQSNPGSTFEAGGQSVIEVTAASNDEFARMMVNPGSFEGGTMRLEVGTPPADDGVFMVLWIEQADGEGRIAYNLAQHGADLSLEARITSEAGPPGAILEEAPWDSVTQRWLQLREDAGTLYFEASEDGSTFGPVFEMPTPIGLADVRVGFVGSNSAPLADDVQVSVETFELFCG